ncbi:hypothetical protein D9615_002985 [Tricholomella constricta]|uniref:Alkyl hydroperoxide reductase subunit C/ Thiol specific antioxidant domain-containing protein n=1 Tax=Tricholomella constricta TaxID=117010 RepID=A0A8H5HGD0_9AGAR|nr:hypothetical protein D9615_002985 [Tricholomella constricta]
MLECRLCYSSILAQVYTLFGSAAKHIAWMLDCGGGGACTGSYGCTKEACQFRDAIAEKDTFKPGKVQIIGLSRDPVEKQKQFVEKEKLTYPVLSDVNGDAVKVYGVGKGMLGLVQNARVTVVIDKKGIVRDTLDATINYAAHSKFVARWLDKLEAEDAAASVATAPTTTATAAEPQSAVSSTPVAQSTD